MSVMLKLEIIHTVVHKPFPFHRSDIRNIFQMYNFMRVKRKIGLFFVPHHRAIIGIDHLIPISLRGYPIPMFERVPMNTR